MQKIWVVVALSFFYSSSYSDIMPSFTENNSIDIISGEVWLSAHFYSPHVDDKGYILRFNPNEEQWSVLTIPCPVLCLAHDDSSLWIGTYGSGLFKYRNGELKQVGKPVQSLSWLNIVNKIVIHDKVYGATEGGLLTFDFSENSWNYYDTSNSPLPTDHVKDIEIQEGLLWVTNNNYAYSDRPYCKKCAIGSISTLNTDTGEWSTISGHVNAIAPGDTNAVKNLIPIVEPAFQNIEFDHNGDLWFSALKNTLGRINSANEVKKYPSQGNDLDIKYIRNIEVGQFGIWATTGKGLITYNDKTDRWDLTAVSSAQIPGSVITATRQDDTSIWIKSYNPNHGYNEYLTHFDGDTWTSWNLTEKLKQLIRSK